MDLLRQHEIAEAGHRILNPFTDEKLALLGELCRWRRDMRLLDLASGKGEMLCTWARRHGIRGLGVDISEVFVRRARGTGPLTWGSPTGSGSSRATPARSAWTRRRSTRSPASGRPGSAAGWPAPSSLMRPALAPGGLLLIGEPFWRETRPGRPTPPSTWARTSSPRCPGTLDRFEAAGLELLEMVLADGDSWDRYVAAQWWTVAEWLDEHPDHPDAAEMREYLDRSRRSHLAYGRRYLGWGVFVLRPAG